MKNKKMKIAFVGGQKLPLLAVRGGATQTLVTAILDQNECRQELDITVFTGYVPELEEAARDYRHTTIVPIRKNAVRRAALLGYRVIRKLSRGKLPRKSDFMCSVNKHLNHGDFDAVILETSQLEAAMLTAGSPDTRVFLHVHSDYIRKNSADLDKAAENCHMLIAVSDYIRGRLSEIEQFYGKVITLKNAIDLDAFPSEERAAVRARVRSRLGFSGKDVVVLYCSRLSPEKGCLELIRAMESTKNCKLLVVGGENFSSNATTDYVCDLQNQAQKLGDRVVFTGAVPHDQVAEYMIASDIGVIPSVCNEAAPLTLVEFRRAGLPVIAANRGGIPEYISPGGTILVEPGKHFTDNLSDAVNWLVQNPENREDMARRADRDMERLGYPAYYEGFLKILRSSVNADKEKQ